MSAPPLESSSDDSAASASDPESVDARAHRLVQRFTALAVAPALVPIPLVDAGLIFAVQLRLVHRLAQVYDAPFQPERARSVLTSLVGGSLTAMSGVTIGRALPVAGWVAGAVTVGAVGAASTWAVGRLFSQHFASGGTLLTFDPEAVRAHYAKLFERGPDATDTATAKPPRRP